jgi:hypothetical protein
MNALAIDPGVAWGAAWKAGSDWGTCSGKLRGHDAAERWRRLAVALYGSPSRANDLISVAPILDAFGGAVVDLLVREFASGRPRGGAPQSGVTTVSMGVSAGVWIGGIPSESLLLPTPGQWNHRGRGKQAAHRAAKKLGLALATDDEVAALGMLLWGLPEEERP